MSLRPLRGLLLAGGQSRRMGRDKAALAYQDQPALRRAFGLLQRHAQDCRVAIRPEQQDEPLRAGLPWLLDHATVQGPMAGLLAAQELDPVADWLVLACDLPGVDDAVLARLCQGRRADRDAVVFAAGDECVEPLCAIWSPSLQPLLRAAAAQGAFSLQPVLRQARLEILSTRDGRLANINTPEDYAAFIGSKP